MSAPASADTKMDEKKKGGKRKRTDKAAKPTTAPSRKSARLAHEKAPEIKEPEKKASDKPKKPRAPKKPKADGDTKPKKAKSPKGKKKAAPKDAAAPAAPATAPIAN